MEGYIKLHREIVSNWIWKDPKKLKWWLTILMSVNHTTTKVNLGNQLIECNRGESIRSLRTWAKLFDTSPKSVRTFFLLLEKDSMLELENIGISTRIKVCNYDKYQGNGNTLETASIHLGNSAEAESKQIHRTNNNGKNGKNGYNDRKKEFIPPSKEEVIAYFRDHGFDETRASTIWESYNVADWHDSRGKPIKNWKQKMLQVWFRPENKLGIDRGQHPGQNMVSNNINSLSWNQET